MSYGYKEADKRVEGTETAPNPYEVINSYSTHVLGIEYGLTEFIDIAMSVPWADNYREFTVPDTGDRYRWRVNGLGDISVMGKFIFSCKHWEGFGEIGVSLPTGKDDEENEFGYVPAFIQTGAGLFVPVIGLGTNLCTGSFRTFANIRYVLAGEMGENDAGYEFVNQLRWSFGARYATKWKMSFGIRADGLAVNGWDKRDGLQVANTGGQWVSITPAISYSHPDIPEVTYSLSYIKPVYWDVHANQAIEDHEMKFTVSFVY